VESYQKELTNIKKILKENPRGMTVTDISREMKINRNSVAKYLDILLISGQAEMVTFGPAKVYFPSRRIPLSAILNYTLDYILLVDKDLKIVRINDNLLDFLDTSRDDLMGQRIDDFISSFFSRSEMFDKIKKALDGKESSIETELENQNLYFRVKNIPTTFDDGEPGATVIIEDISEQKKAENRMKKLLTEWETTFNSIKDMISIHDKNFNIVKANKAFIEFFNSERDVINKKCYEIIHGKKISHSYCPCKKIKETKKPHTVDFYEPNIDRYIEISASPIFNEEGEYTGSVHIIKDITDRKKK
jgi:PAS domain S-box-containing protein